MPFFFFINDLFFSSRTQLVLRDGQQRQQRGRRGEESGARARARDLLLPIHRRRPEPTAAAAAASVFSAAATPAIRCGGVRTSIRWVFANSKTRNGGSGSRSRGRSRSSNNSRTIAIISALPISSRPLGQNSKSAAG